MEEHINSAGLKFNELWKYVKIPKLTNSQKQQFSDSFNIQAIIFFRFTSYIILIAIIPYYYLDYYSAPHTYKAVWLIRFVSFFVVVVLGLWMSYQPFIIKYFQVVSNSVNILLNLSILLMIYVSEVDEPAYRNYYVGLIVIMGVVIAMRIRLYPSMLNFGLIVGLYVLLAVFYQKLPLEELINNLFFMLTIVLAMLVANFLIEIYTRKAFLQEKLLEQRAKDLESKNREIKIQHEVVVEQKKLVESIHHELAQSIDYAKRLQNAILPETKVLKNYVSDSFLFFKPKDKVSGDFYWWAHLENNTVIAVADCTGHGVPGAFMSMLGSSFLREIVQKEYITHTGVILRKLRKDIIKTLKQTGEVGTQKDGMDMAIISINHDTGVVQFSGANNPLYIITDRELSLKEEGGERIKLYTETIAEKKTKKNLYEIKPDKMPIAIYEKMEAFKTHKIELHKGDQLYMFSDGYVDQFGGEKGKKFKNIPFKRLLLENANKSMSEQKEVLVTTFENWKGALEQIDDVLVLGIKIKG